MLEGHMRHRDSAGNEGHLGPGDVQWMTAGKGIVHSEMPEMDNGLMWGYQLWVNLPAAQKMVEPRYQDISAAQIPELVQSGCRVRVIAGHYKDIEGASQTRIPVLYLDVTLSSGACFDHSLPATHRGFLHMVQGQVFSGDAMVAAAGTGSTPVLDSGAALGLLAGEAGARFLLIAGEPIGEPIARHGPFVMNTRDELVQAFEDYQNGLF
jgi:redox-sensitive bicupin YhaK (pirin superfamily)